jgi:acyl transferase domain-containing protein
VSDSDERVLQLLREARQQLESDRKRRNEPIAIVGIGCRLPGGVNDPEAFWSLLEAGRHVMGEVPADRWDNDAIYDPDPDRPGKTYASRGAFLDRIDGFEPEFFGISPREAAAMDPQQRMLLEVVWEALEDAGIRPDALKGSATGVWVGMSADDYARRNASGDLSLIDPYTALGNARSIAVGRISYFLDLHGPAVQVDTACSSSLVAVHQACQSLRTGECERAIVGGVNLMISPESTVALSKLRALAVDGRCKTFDAAADGYGRGEGCGIVVLSRLSDALAEKRSIYAVIRGSAINHDGRSNGLTAPNGAAQEEVIRTALANAGVASDAVGYVETHGTGTLLGDPIEVLALNRVYGVERGASHPLRLGALKTNVGHLEAAAGIAGLIKVALCLSQRRLVPSLHFTQPNPKIPWDSMNVEVVTEAGPWVAESVRVGAVSSFGISGTNAVLEEAPGAEPREAIAARSAELILLSARTETSLKAAAGRLAQHLATHPDLALGDLAYGLASSRSRMDQLLAVVAPTPQALVQSLRAAADSDAVKLGSLSGVASNRVAFVFAGQGSQWLGMGRQLLAEESVFRASMAECDRVIRSETGWSVLDELMASEADSRFDRIDVIQPVLFAMQRSLAELWQSWGVKPHAVIGHSMGEVAAACVAGALSLEDGASVICRRSRLLKRISGKGQMALVELSIKDARLAIEGLEDQLSVAVSNSSRSTVLSGDPSALTQVLSKLEDRGVFCRRVKVDVASHSPQVDPLLDEIVSALRAIEPKPGHTAMVSTVTGEVSSGQELTPEYWARNLRQPVHFAQASKVLIDLGIHRFLEVGPHPLLVPAITEVLQDAGVEGTAVGSLRRDQPERLTLLEALGALVMTGHSESVDGVFQATSRHVRLPTYAWDRQRYWLDVPHGLERSAPARAGAAGSPLAREANPANESVYRLEWKASDPAMTAPVCHGRWGVVSSAGDDRAGELAASLRARGAISEVLNLHEISGPLDFDHVVCDWDLPDAGADAAIRATLEVLRIIQGLARSPRAPRLWLTTRGAMPVRPGDSISAAASAVWGLGRTAMHEHPELRCVLLDLERSAPLADVLAREATAPGDENQVAWRAGHRYVLRIVRAPEAAKAVAASPQSWSSSGSALVTGGLGGLGMAVARSLARSGVKLLVLTGRNVQRAEAATLRDELEPLGTQLMLAAADASDSEAMARVIGSIPDEHPLRVVVHLAGIFDDGLLLEQTPERVTKVFASKVAGAWNLHRLTEGMDLHAFVLFSSLAGVLGSAGEGSYSAANAYLDGLAALRRAQGARALSLDWGPWAELGMAATLNDEQKARFLRHGIDMLEPASAVTLFEQVLAVEPAPSQLIVARLDLREMSRAMGPWLLPVWHDLLGTSRGAGADTGRVGDRADGAGVGNGFSRGQAEKSAAGEAALAEALERLAPAERPSYLRDWLAKQSASILGYSDSSRINLRRGFFDMGMDSLMVLHLRRRLEGALGRKVSATVTFAHPNIMALAEHLLVDRTATAQTAPPAEPVAAPAPAEPEQKFESEEDALRFINSRFESDDE